MNLIKTSYITAVSVVIRTLTLLILGKIIALKFGPNGTFFAGNIRNFLGIAISFGAGALTNGIIKNVSEYKGNKLQTKRFLETASVTTLVMSFATAVMIYVFNESIAKNILSDTSYSYIIKLFSFFIIFFVFNMFFGNILNGNKKVKIFLKLNIAFSIFNLIYLFIWINLYGLTGLFYGMLTSQAVFSVAPLAIVLKNKMFKFKYFIGKIDKYFFKKLSFFYLMAIVSTISANVSLVIIRNYIAAHSSNYYAGLWESLFQVSSFLAMFFTTLLTVYYLPKMSELKNKHDIQKEFIKSLKIIVFISFISVLGIYILKDFLINLLYSDKYLQVSSLFLYQLAGDFFRNISWLIFFLFVSKTMFLKFILIESAYGIGFVLFTIFAYKLGGFQNISLGYLINNIVYAIILFFLAKKTLKRFPVLEQKNR